MDILKKLLIELRDCGCSGIKISFEDEGALLNEIISMRYLTASVGLELSIKIGGCEAKRDIQDCIDINSDSIVSPMIESKFSLSKFISSSTNYTGNRGINIETINAYNNLNDISELFNNLQFVTFGRVDFASSLDKDRSFVNSEYMFETAKHIYTQARKHGAKCYLGGAITTDSYNFIRHLYELKLLDKIETRYVIFDLDKIDMTKYNEIIYKSNVFEVEWLKYVQNRYSTLELKDAKRIQMMSTRI
jgi:hypothetical protein